MEREKIIKEIKDIADFNTSASFEELNKFRDVGGEEMKAFENLSNIEFIEKGINELNEIESRKNEYLLRLQLAQSKRQILRLKRGFAVAAAVIAVSFMAYYGGEHLNREEEVVIAASESVVEKSATPATPHIILEDGSVISIDKKTKEGVAVVTTSELSTLITSNTPNEVKSEINTVVIPTRNSMTLTLDDGTKVMLNAGSKLAYPSQFSTSQREVKLEGEAFFDVTKSEIPFVVRTELANVRVYGTEFNINAYSGGEMETVLVSGSVGVTREGGEETILKPSQKITIDETGAESVETIDVSGYLSWTKGVFITEEGTMGDLITEIERWYGVKFINLSNDIKKQSITSSIDRTLDELEIISAIEIIIDKKIQKIDSKTYVIK